MPSAVLANASLTAKLQSPTGRMDLEDKRTSRGASVSRPNPAPLLGPSENLDMIVEHTLEELGTHTLRVTVKYHVAGTPEGSEPRSMRKFYRFSVMNPVTLSSSCTAVRGTPFVELQLVNTTQVLSRMMLVVDLASLDRAAADGCLLTAVERFDGRVLLRPEESHQLMYTVRPKSAAASLPGGGEGLATAGETRAEGEGGFGEGSHTLGRVEVCWRTTTGESGSVRSGPVVYEGPDRPEVEVAVDGLPDVLKLGSVAECVATVRNRANRAMTLQLQFRTDGMVGVYVHGQSFRNLGEILPGGCVRCPLQLLALVAGLHELRGCTVADMHTAQEFPQGKLRDILVEFPDDEDEEFGASFLSPKPLLASLQRGRSLADASSASSRSRAASPPPHHRGSGRGGGHDGRSGSSSGGGPRMLGASGVLAPAELELQSDGGTEEDLAGEPLTWTESLGSGGPLFYSRLLRWQASALQLELGLDRSAVPQRMDTVCNPDKQSRVRNLVYTGERVRKVRMSYLDTPGMQVYSSVAYSAPGFDFPLLSLSAMAMGHVRVLALDLCPLFPDAEYAAKYASANAKLKAIRDKYPAMGEELKREYYKGSPFFSKNMMYARYGPEEEASGFVENVVLPAFKETLAAYVEIVNTAPAQPAPGSPTEQAVLKRQAEFDRFHSEREQYHGNREAIRLYREILKATRLFHWCNERGEPWGRILRESSRKEFEQARHETDPLVVARLLVVGRQCLNDTIRGLEKTERTIADKIKETRTR
eukprot:g9705.t1